MAKNVEFYVKNTSNSSGYPLTSVPQLSAEWSGDSITIPFYDGDALDGTYKVVGITDLYGGVPCDVRCFKTTFSDDTGKDHEGILILGGNSGVRVLSENARYRRGPDHRSIDGHLPRGYGYPFLFIAEEDIPQDVLDVLNQPFDVGADTTA